MFSWILFIVATFATVFSFFRLELQVLKIFRIFLRSAGSQRVNNDLFLNVGYDNAAIAVFSASGVLTNIFSNPFSTLSLYALIKRLRLDQKTAKTKLFFFSISSNFFLSSRSHGRTIP